MQGIVSVRVVVEEIGEAEPSDRHHHTASRTHTGLVRRGDRLSRDREGLPQEEPGRINIWARGTKMCLARMREAACEMIGEACGIGARVIASGSDASDSPEPYLQRRGRRGAARRRSRNPVGVPAAARGDPALRPRALTRACTA